MKSMTGYGKGKYQGQYETFTLEIKSVNHRFMDIKMRLPKGYLYIEDMITRKINSKFSRGSFSIYLDIINNLSDAQSLDLNYELIENILSTSIKLKEDYSIINNIGVSEILKYPEVINRGNGRAIDVKLIWKEIEKALDEAIVNIDIVRSDEGESLKKDFINRVQIIEEKLMLASTFLTNEVGDHRTKLIERITEALMDLKVELDQDKLMNEIVIYSDKTDVTEELIRLNIHLKNFNELINSKEPVGRKIEFLLQEINREINTLGTKSNLVEVSNIVIELKSELEKIREQIQNIE